jgi:hypothetical protein
MYLLPPLENSLGTLICYLFFHPPTYLEIYALEVVFFQKLSSLLPNYWRSIFFNFLPKIKYGNSIWQMAGDARASSIVPHLGLPFLFYFAKSEKPSLNRSHHGFPFIPSLENEPLHVNICARRCICHIGRGGRI